MPVRAVLLASLAALVPAPAASARWMIERDTLGTLTVRSLAAPYSTCEDAGGVPISDTVAAVYVTRWRLVRVERREPGAPDVIEVDGLPRTTHSPRLRMRLEPRATETFRTLLPVPNSQPEACTQANRTCTAESSKEVTEGVRIRGARKRVTVLFPARLIDQWIGHCAPRGAARLIPGPTTIGREGVTEEYPLSAFRGRHPTLRVSKTFRFAAEPGQEGSPFGEITYAAKLTLRRVARR